MQSISHFDALHVLLRHAFPPSSRLKSFTLSTTTLAFIACNAGHDRFRRLATSPNLSALPASHTWPFDDQAFTFRLCHSSTQRQLQPYSNFRSSHSEVELRLFPVAVRPSLTCAALRFNCQSNAMQFAWLPGPRAVQPQVSAADCLSFLRSKTRQSGSKLLTPETACCSSTCVCVRLF